MSGALTVKRGRTTYSVGSVEDAAAKWCAYRDAAMRSDPSRAGCSSLGNGVKVYDGARLVARVSYNGRIWPVAPLQVAA